MGITVGWGKGQEPRRTEKAAEDYEGLHRAADLWVPAIRNGFSRAILRMKDEISITDLYRALESQDAETVMASIPWATLEDGLGEGLREAFGALIRAGGVSSLHMLGRALELEVIDSRSGGAAALGPQPGTLQFNVLNPRAVRWVDENAAKAVVEVSAETKLAVRDVVSRAFTLGGHPRTQAREIRSFIGLTRRLTGAVFTFRDRTARQLAQAHPTWSAEKIAEQAEHQAIRYHLKLLTYRGNNIARTETMTASIQGRWELWAQAEEQGYLDRSVAHVKWLITPDDRLCPLCAQMVGDLAVVPYGTMFSTPKGYLQGPLMHPSCRCVPVLFFKRVAA